MPLPPTRPGQREGMTEEGGPGRGEAGSDCLCVCVCVQTQTVKSETGRKI